MKRRTPPPHWLANLRALYHHAQPGDWSWYYRAHNRLATLASTTGHPLPHVAAACAALSPESSWNRNLADTVALVAQSSSEQPFDYKFTTYSLNVEKARLALSGVPIETLFPTGPKVQSFYRLLLEPTHPTEVCVDRHLAKAVNLQSSLTPFKYSLIQRAVRIVASQLSLQPAALQALIWSVVRRGIQTQQTPE